jgi:hypothetical protein
MTKKRLVTGIASLILSAALIVPTIASAHEAVSSLGNKSTSRFLASHLIGPDFFAWVHVGWDPLGFYINTTTSVSIGNTSYQLRSYDRCFGGSSFPTTPLVTVTQADLWIRGSATCGGTNLAQGGAGISE